MVRPTSTTVLYNGDKYGSFAVSETFDRYIKFNRVSSDRASLANAVPYFGNYVYNKYDRIGRIYKIMYKVESIIRTMLEMRDLVRQEYDEFVTVEDNHKKILSFMMRNRRFTGKMRMEFRSVMMPAFDPRDYSHRDVLKTFENMDMDNIWDTYKTVIRGIVGFDASSEVIKSVVEFEPSVVNSQAPKNFVDVLDDSGMFDANNKDVVIEYLCTSNDEVLDYFDAMNVRNVRECNFDTWYGLLGASGPGCTLKIAKIPRGCKFIVNRGGNDGGEQVSYVAA